MEKILAFLKDNKDALSILIATFLGFLTLVTFIKAIFEYRLQGRQKRAELYQTFELKFDEENIKEITELLENDDPAIINVPIIDRYYFIGLYEEIALAVNSRLVNKNVAHYMFGYFAIKCWNNADFWQDLNRDSYYWSVFRRFANQMKEIEQKKLYRSKYLRFCDRLIGRNNFKY